MALTRRSLIRRILWGAGLAVTSIGLAIAEKIYEYAAPPKEDKSCDFVYPKNDSKVLQLDFEPDDKPPFALAQSGGFINDASCLNKTPIYGIVSIKSEDDLRKALEFARRNQMKVTASGQRHSMGGQSFSEHGIVLDMRSFNRIRLNKKDRILTSQSGATWAHIQSLLDGEGLSVKAMQSINVPTVGGTLSVNAHGIAHSPGQIAPTVKSMRIMLADGTVEFVSPTQNSELFRLALGGYGLFGVILEADIEVVPNELYSWKSAYMDYRDFPEYYAKNVEGNDAIGLAYGRLSVSPSSYLKETAFHTYEKVSAAGPIPALEPLGNDWLVRLVLNVSKLGGGGRRLRWELEKHVEPKIYPCLSRNQAMVRGEGCFVTRNHEMADSMGYLKTRLEETNILQEYFIPRDRMANFVDGLRQIVERDEANLLNVTIRIVHRDTATALPYAKQDMFSFVLYFNQKLTDDDSKRLQKTTRDLIDLALGLDGTYYLPYQLYYSVDQLRRAYPEVDSFFEAKRKYDPAELFTNKFYEKYGNASV